MERETIHYAASLTVILGFIGVVFSYVVLRPLNTAISNLNEAVLDLRKEISAAENRWHDLEIKVAEIDQRARSAHHRIDGLEGRQRHETGD